MSSESTFPLLVAFLRSGRRPCLPRLASWCSRRSIQSRQAGTPAATSNRAFTLAEVLAALLFMAILIPVTMHGVSVASRTGILGQRRAAAMRIAERVLDEQILSGQMATATPYGSIAEGDFTYSWTMRSDPWPEDLLITMNVVTIRVEFSVQGSIYDVAISTLHDPSVTSTTTTPEAAMSSTAEP